MGAADVWVRTDHEGEVHSMDRKPRVPTVEISRRCGAINENVGGYRSLMSDREYEELTAPAKSLQGVKICQVNPTAASGAWC